MIHENEETRTYEIEIQYSENILDCILTFAYGGDKLEIYQGDELLNDYYYTGEPAELSLRYFDFPEKLLVKIYALHELSLIHIYGIHVVHSPGGGIWFPEP